MRIFLCLLLLFAVCGCAAKTPPGAPTDVQPATSRAGQEDTQDIPSAADGVVADFNAPAPEQTENLRGFLAAALKRQYMNLATIYSAPEPGFEDDYHMLVAEEPARLHLADKAVGYGEAWDKETPGLAVGKEDGTILVVGRPGCSSLVLPGDEQPDMLAWNFDSDVLAVADADGLLVRVYDVSRCAGVGEVELESRPSAMAVSRTGRWLAAVDKGHKLYMGPAVQASGQVANVSSLRFDVLDMAFTPKSELLMLVDVGGWVTFWDPAARKMVDKFQVAGGPFTAARFSGPHAALTADSGEETVVHLKHRQPVDAVLSPEPYSLDQGVLYFVTRTAYMVKKLLLGPARLQTWFSRELDMFKVQDLDGRTRYYDAADGAQTPAAPVNADKADWAPASFDEAYATEVEDRTYVFADPVFQTHRMRLFCRHVEGRGFYLWWRDAGQVRPANPRPGELPVRLSIAEGSPVEWRAIIK